VALADGQAATGTRVARRPDRPVTLQDALERLLADGRQVQRDSDGRRIC